MRSLRSRLLVVWLLSVAAAVVVGLILVGLYRQSTGAQLDRATAAVAESCQAIGDRFAFYAAGWAGPVPAPGTAEAAAFAADLGQVLAVALAGRAGVAGGLWLDGAPLAATQPLAPDLRATIAALAADDDRTGATHIARRRRRDAAGPGSAAGGLLAGLAAFANARRPDRLRFGLAGLSRAGARRQPAGRPPPGRAAPGASPRRSPAKAPASAPMSRPPASPDSTSPR